MSKILKILWTYFMDCLLSTTYDPNFFLILELLPLSANGTYHLQLVDKCLIWCVLARVQPSDAHKLNLIAGTRRQHHLQHSSESFSVIEQPPQFIVDVLPCLNFPPLPRSLASPGQRGRRRGGRKRRRRRRAWTWPRRWWLLKEREREAY